jgi:hypothetical protein
VRAIFALLLTVLTADAAGLVASGAPPAPPLLVLAAQTNKVHQGAIRPERILGVCEIVDNGERRGANGETYVNNHEIYPVFDAISYFQKYEQRNDFTSADTYAATSNVLQAPEHGKLVYDGRNPVPGIFRYIPEAGYVGDDFAMVLVEIKGMIVKISHFFHVLPSSSRLGECEDTGGVWKISKTSDGHGTETLPQITWLLR